MKNPIWNPRDWNFFRWMGISHEKTTSDYYWYLKVDMEHKIIVL